MCGIVGVISRSARFPVTEAMVAQMRDTMIHRGPDDQGLHLFHEQGLTIGLGHRRLSIIDLSPLGRQPLATKDEKLWIVFNGEIFNYRELRAELESAGVHEFRTRTDTEVILYAVREWGLEGTLKRLRGMYAFAIYDRADGSLTLVRDPLGVKPLYYWADDSRFMFGSEIKSLLASGWIEKRVDPVSLWHYLTFANSPAPRTLFAGVRKLEAGSYLKIDRQGAIKQVR